MPSGPRTATALRTAHKPPGTVFPCRRMRCTAMLPSLSVFSLAHSSSPIAEFSHQLWSTFFRGKITTAIESEALPDDNKPLQWPMIKDWDSSSTVASQRVARRTSSRQSRARHSRRQASYQTASMRVISSLASFPNRLESSLWYAPTNWCGVASS